MFLFMTSQKGYEAEGNVILVLGDQIFRAEKINFDFQNKQGSFIK